MTPVCLIALQAEVHPEQSRLWIFPEQPPPEARLVWKWTDTVVPEESPELLWAPPAGADEEHRHRIEPRLGQLYRRNMNPEGNRRLSATMRPPLLETDTESDHILVLDAEPNLTDLALVGPASALSIVVTTKSISTRSWKCVALLKSRLDIVRVSPERFLKLTTTASLLVSLLKIPYLKILEDMEAFENQLLELHWALQSGRLSMFGYANEASELALRSYRVALCGRVLRGYERICEQVLDPHLGAFSVSASDAQKLEAKECVSDLKTGIAALSSRASYLSEQIASIERLLESKRQLFANRIITLLTLLFLPAGFVAGVLGMNIGYPKHFSLGFEEFWRAFLLHGTPQSPGLAKMISEESGLGFAILAFCAAVIVTMLLTLLVITTRVAIEIPFRTVSNLLTRLTRIPRTVVGHLIKPGTRPPFPFDSNR